MTRVLFVNSGILGMASFSIVIRDAMKGDPEIEASHIDLSDQEAFGTVFQEAAAAGLPRIGTRINAIPEIVHDGRSRLLVTPGDPGELIGALRRLIASAEMRREFGCAGGRIIEQAGPEKYVSKLRSIVQSIASRPS